MKNTKARDNKGLVHSAFKKNEITSKIVGVYGGQCN